MKDTECIQFLQWALPQLKMHWPGFRKVRGQVCKRIGRRMRELSIQDAAAYRIFLDQHSEEWDVLDNLCRVTISRFYRDKGVFDDLKNKVIPELVRALTRNGEKTLRCWCAGASSGEEPYTVALIWNLEKKETHPEIEIQITATEIDQTMLSRAESACYPSSSIKELAIEWQRKAFIKDGDLFCLVPEYRKLVSFVRQDIRKENPPGLFSIIFCRNLVFTYLNRDQQGIILNRIKNSLKPGGVLVIGAHESLPEPINGFIPWDPGKKIFKKK
jgi:chemotaxis protein methyltransferase CheR